MLRMSWKSIYATMCVFINYYVGDYAFDKSNILSIYNKLKMTVGPMGRRTNGS